VIAANSLSSASEHIGLVPSVEAVDRRKPRANDCLKISSVHRRHCLNESSLTGDGCGGMMRPDN